jgi:2-aminoadipate transaminase
VTRDAAPDEPAGEGSLAPGERREAVRRRNGVIADGCGGCCGDETDPVGYDEADLESSRVDHLFSETVRETLGQSAYGAWREVDAPGAVSLAFGFPFPGSFPYDELLAAAGAVVEAEPDRMLQYGGGEHADRLPELVAGRERDRGVDCSDEAVVLTGGANHAIDLVCRLFLDPGDHLLTGAPTFMGALSSFGNHAVEVTGVPVDGDGLDVGAVEAELRERRAGGRPVPKLVYAVPTFQNPTGITLPRDRREHLLELAAEFDFAVLEDDAYGELRYDGDDVPPLAALDDAGRVVRVGTFSKTVAPGVRTGWAVAHEEVAAQLRRLNAGGPNVFTQGTVARYVEDHFEDNVDRLRAAYAERRDHMLDCLDAHMPDGTDWTEPEGGFFVWVTLPEGVDAEALLPAAAEEGVTYLPGEMFYPDGGGERSLRLSFSHVDLGAMEEGVAALGRAAARPGGPSPTTSSPQDRLH